MGIRQSFLISKAASFQQTIQESMLKSASMNRVRSAFFCHSHKDELMVKGLIAVFQEADIELYIDWMDHTMPDIPNAVTAKKIQEKIKDCELFFFLATSNSKASRWCPWEIGYADSAGSNIYIVPTSDGGITYGNEYLDLYANIDQGSEGLGVFRAGQTSGQRLSSKSF